MAMPPRNFHHGSQSGAATMRPLDRNAKLAMWSPYHTERHPLAPPDSPVKKVQLMRRNGKIGYAVTYQKPGGDTPPRLIQDARRADNRCCLDEARRLRTQEWLDTIEPCQALVETSVQTQTVERNDRCRSPRRKPAASEHQVPASEGIANGGQQSLVSTGYWPGDAAEGFNLTSAWPVSPAVPSPPATPWIPLTPDLSPLPDDRDFCPCDGVGGEAPTEEWNTKMAIDAQVSAARAYIQRAQASARGGR